MTFYFSCPNCGSNEEFTVPHEEPSGLGCSLLVFGDLLSALLYHAAQRRRVQCARCRYIFAQPRMPRSAVSVFARRITAIAVFFPLVFLIFLTAPNGDLPIPDAAILHEFEQIVAQHPRAVILVLLPFVAVLILSCLAGSWIGNFKYRRELRKTYRTRVTYYAQVPPATSSKPAFPVQTQDRPTQSP